MSSNLGRQTLSGAIAHVTFSGDFGGREKVAVELCRSLRDLGQESLLYVVIEERAGSERVDNLMDFLGDVEHFAHIFKTRYRFSPSLLFQLASSYRAQSVEFVHCHCYKSLAYTIIMRFLKIYNGALICTLHGLDLPSGLMSALIARCQQFGLCMADGVIGCSKEYLSNFFPNPKKVKTITIINAIQLPEKNFKALQTSKSAARDFLLKKYDLNPDGLIVINVGRLSPVKNFPLFLQLIRDELAANMNVKTNFLIVGSGKLLDVLVFTATQLGIREHVVFTDFVKDMDVVYRGADVLVQTSIMEGTPMCLLEARSYGLPVVAPAVGGNVDVVESGRDGFLYPVSDIDALMRHYVSYVLDHELRKTHGRAAFERIRREFGTRDWALTHLEFYSCFKAGKTVL